MFAHELLKKLPNVKDESGSQKLIPELEHQIRGIKSYASHGAHRYEQLDALGTDLWNTCIRLNRDNEDATALVRKTLILARVFAFQILSLAQDIGDTNSGRLIRLAKLAIKSGRSCIGKLHMLYNACLLAALTALKTETRSILRYLCCRRPPTTTGHCRSCKLNFLTTNKPYADDWKRTISFFER